MEELSKKNRKSTVSLLIVLVALLTLLYLWERKSNSDRLLAAKQNTAESDSLLLVYRQLHHDLFKVISKHDSTLKMPPKTNELTSLLAKILSRYKTENGGLFERNQQVIEVNLSLNKKNKTLQEVVRTLGGEIIEAKNKEKVSDEKIEYLSSVIDLEKSTFDSLSKAFESKLLAANTAIPDSLHLVSPQGVKLFYYGKVEHNQPNGFGVGFYEGQGYYIGEWKSNARSGYGKHFYKDGSTYQGNFNDDLREGYGTYHYPTGETYRGNWEKNLMNGSGELSETNGQTHIGAWKDGKLLRK